MVGIHAQRVFFSLNLLLETALLAAINRLIKISSWVSFLFSFLFSKFVFWSI
jgi:hypothetical protein